MDCPAVKKFPGMLPAGTGRVAAAGGKPGWRPPAQGRNQRNAS